MLCPYLHIYKKNCAKVNILFIFQIITGIQFNILPIQKENVPL